MEFAPLDWKMEMIAKPAKPIGVWYPRLTDSLKWITLVVMLSHITLSAGLGFRVGRAWE